MQLVSCFNPQKVRDAVTREQRLVPCGKCPACLRHKSSLWVQRLDQERYCWKYAVFFTLTYAPEHVPQLKVCDNHLIASTPEIRPASEPPLVIDLDEVKLKHSLGSDDWNKTVLWLHKAPFIGVVSSYHLSKFIKRFRTYANRIADKFYLSQGIKEQVTFRYFAIGEYGSTTLRPHYHGLLFFNSEFLASRCEDIISKSWKFGITDSSFVSDTNSKYVASYLNSLGDLPAVYRHKYTRPFFLCSKFPPIGTLSHNSKEIRQLFFSGDIKFTIFDHSKNLFDNVPLWRTLKNRLYPRLSGFSQLSHFERIALYRFTEKTPNFNSFLARINGVFGYVPNYVKDYVTYLDANCDNLNVALQRWFYTSRRVITQSASFEISVADYVTSIENFYSKCDYENLKSLYKFQNDYVDNGKRLSDLLSVDELFIRSFVGIDPANVSYEEIEVLRSYGVDVDKFFSEDLQERTLYQESLLPESTHTYQSLRLDAELWQSRAVKNKKKNDYLELHPEAQNFIF